jgi:hypothetical protein
MADSPAAKPAENGTTEKTKSDKTRFVRLAMDAKDRPTSLDVAITSYAGQNAAGDEVRVDLVGVIHIADKAYYHRLNKEFDKYDVVLYELVAPKGVKPTRGTTGLYSPVANMLELADQIAEVDYSKKNFVHADMSGEEMLESMKKRDEHWLKMVGQAIGQGIAQASDPKSGASDGALLANLLTSRSPGLAWKRTLAPQFSDLEHAMGWLDGPEGSTLITERNKVALKVLAEQMKVGKRRLAIFYGAGHLPDMERRLIDEFKLKRGEQSWLVAWNLSSDAAPPKIKKVTPSPKTPAVGEKEFLRASQALLDEPVSQAAADHAKTVMIFTAQTPKAMVIIGDDEIKWFGKNEDHKSLLMGAYSAGNVQSQLNSGVVRNDRYSGVLYLLKVYRGLQAKDKDLKIVALEDLIKLHKDDKLLRHIAELDAKDSAKRSEK